MDIDGIFAGLRRLDHELAGNSVNKHDRCITLITACIPEGIDTRKRIVGTMAKLGFDHRHVAIILDKDAGTNPALHRWMIGEDGTYRLHEGTAEAA